MTTYRSFARKQTQLKILNSRKLGCCKHCMFNISTLKTTMWKQKLIKR